MERHRQRYGVLGPIILITLGVMFLIGQFFPAWGVWRTWPALLIIIGVTKLLEAIGSRGATRPN